MARWTKSVLAVGAAVFLAIASVSAAPNPLGITDAQRSKLTALEKQGRKEATAVQIGLGTPAEKNKRIQAIAKKYHDAEMAVLTPAQRAKLDAKLAAQKKTIAQIVKVKKTITSQQRAKMEGIQATFRSKAQVIIQSKKLSDAQKRAQLTALQVQMNSALKGVLTAKQRAALPK